jgi:hypothetical protein
VALAVAKCGDLSLLYARLHSLSLFSRCFQVSSIEVIDREEALNFVNHAHEQADGSIAA